MRVLIAGAGGFIGGHLVKRLAAEGHEVFSADKKRYTDWWQLGGRTLSGCDLSQPVNAREAVRWAKPQWAFNLAADMGGMGFISANEVACMRNSLINHALLDAVAAQGCESRYLFASSACAYPDVAGPLSEERAYPAMPDSEYGWDKLFSERYTIAVGRSAAVRTRVVRLHNVYGPHGSWRDGREKAPAALCRKVAEALLGSAAEDGGSIDVWGDGTAKRTFLYADDCVDGLLAVMRSDCAEPLNVGSEELVSVETLANMCIAASGRLPHGLAINWTPGPVGVRERSSDNSRVTAATGWRPRTGLAAGLAETYRWISGRVADARSRPDAANQSRSSRRASGGTPGPSSR